MLYSTGIEDAYYGNKVRYKENTNVFIFYYFKNYQVLYIVNDLNGTVSLPEVEGKVNVVLKINEKKIINRIKKILSSSCGSKLFEKNESFFYLFYSILLRKKYEDYLEHLFLTY